MTTIPPSIDLNKIRVLSFDIYGTLVDWETGIVENLRASPLQASLAVYSRQDILELFEKVEGEIQGQHPDWLESEILTELFQRFAKRLNISEETEGFGAAARTFGSSMGRWPVFADTPAAMQKLAKSYKLVALSNVDRESFNETMAGPLRDVRFDAVHTAAEIGSFKPDPRNFQYLLDAARHDFGAEKETMLHVACSLYHDVAPATQAGMQSVFVNRRGIIGTKLGPRLDPKDLMAARKIYGFSHEVDSLGQLVDEMGL